MIKNDVAFVVVGAKSKAELDRCLQGIFDQAVPDACNATVYYANPLKEPDALVERRGSPINVQRIDRRPDDIGDVANDVLLISKEISETHEWIWIIQFVIAYEKRCKSAEPLRGHQAVETIASMAYIA